MKITRHTVYEAEIDGTGYQLRFLRIKPHHPGWTHRVLIARRGEAFRPYNWLSWDYKPSFQTARFYFEKHVRNGKILSKTELAQTPVAQ